MIVLGLDPCLLSARDFAMNSYETRMKLVNANEQNYPKHLDCNPLTWILTRVIVCVPLSNTFCRPVPRAIIPPCASGIRGSLVVNPVID